MPQVEAINMIILKLNYFKSNKKKITDIFDIYRNSFDFINLECPHCRSDKLIKWGSYKRIIYYLDNNILKCISLEIKRVKCLKCNKTHALIPEYIIPYKQPLLDIILLSIDNYEISYEFPFSYEIVEKWKRNYRKLFLPYLKTMFNNIKEIIPKILENIFATYEEFYSLNKKILMMTHKGIINMAYF